MRAEMGTPLGSSQFASIDGHWLAGAVKREFGCAALCPRVRPISGVQSCPVQSMRCAGGSGVMPSHQTSPSSVSATFVKTTFSFNVAIALGLVCSDVPGATPKKPASGLMAYSRPSAPGLSQAMSSPTVEIFQPSNERGGISMAKLVLPQADGKA